MAPSLIETRSTEVRGRVDAVLEQWIDAQDVAVELQAAMRYSVFIGGKRVRPLLVFAAAEAVGCDDALVEAAAAAVECVHAYSLIHDDLPAMDDDALRRGQPTCHIRFDEATAILAGDALQALAFDGLLAAGRARPEQALTMGLELARASGARGMVAGQQLDLEAEAGRQPATLACLERIHAHKTGALIRAAVRLGGLAGQANTDQMAALDLYANALGLAFQVQDDILDVTSATDVLGKTQGADIARGKMTYVSLLGLSEAKARAQQLIDEALLALRPFNDSAALLRAIAEFVIARQY